MADDHNILDEHKDVPVPETNTATETAPEQPEEQPGPETEPEMHEAVVITPAPGKLHGWARMLLAHKKVVIPTAVLVVLVAALAIVPFTRYRLAGLVIKRDYSVIVVDSQNGKPVTSATVKLGSKSAQTDIGGGVKLREPSGEAKLTVSKKYYKTLTREVLVPIGMQRKPLTVELEATGRQVPVTITNLITGKPVTGATVKASGSEAKTDERGEAILVVPAGQAEVTGTVNADGYNAADITITVTTDKIVENTFAVTPAGVVYFLSNASGKLDVIKSNLDGTGRSTVLAGTGKEDKNDTVLLTSRDWKYVALLSKRDGGANAKVFVIDTAGDKLTTVDEGDASFELVGWSGDRLVYMVSRNTVQDWEPKQQSIKSYHAPAKKLTTLDDTTAEGTEADYRRERIGAAYVLADEVVYVKNWTIGNYYGDFDNADKQVTFNSIRADGNQKKVVKAYDFSNTGYLSVETRPAELGTIYIRQYDAGAEIYEEYKDGKITGLTLTDSEFYDNHPKYSISPSGNKVFWSEYRNGKNVFFVADSTSQNGKQLGTSQDYAVYGWFTDEYVLVSNKGSELHIFPAAGTDEGIEASLKISDFYLPVYGYYSHGYGY